MFAQGWSGISLQTQERNKSFVWQHFKKTDLSYAACTLCEQVFEIKNGNTRGLSRHLRSKHNKIKSIIVPTISDQQSSDNKQITSYLSKDFSRAKELTEAIARMIILDLHSCTIVENVGFRSLLNITEPQYEIPSSSVLAKSIIPQKYKELRKEISDKIEMDMAAGGAVFAFTIDGWISPPVKEYLSLTIHYITTDFKSCHYMLNLTRLTKSYTSEYLRNVLLTSLNTWRLGSNTKPLFFVTDNGRDIVKAIEGCENWTRIPCYVQCLQLAIKDTITKYAEYSAVRKKCSHLVGFFSQSTSSRKRFIEIQKTDNPHKEPQELIEDVDMQFNSIYDMLCRLVLLRRPLTTLLGENNTPKNLTIDEWNFAVALKTVLHEVKEATQMMCAEDYPTLSQYIPMYIGLVNALAPDDTLPEKVNEIASNFCIALKTHFKVIKRHDIFVQAMLLDPRYKHRLLPSKEKKIEAINQLKQKIVCTENDIDVGTKNMSTAYQYDAISPILYTIRQPNSRITKFFHETLGSTKHERRPSLHYDINGEMQTYFSEHLLPQKTNIIDWWKCNRTRFPALASAARQYIAIPATQVSSKRLHPCTSNSRTVIRAMSISEPVEELCFLHSNLR